MIPGPINRLALGTAQFGLAYGLASGYQQVEMEEVTDILFQARKAGVDVIDTAASYGQSEDILRSIDFVTSFKIVSKTLPIRQDCITSDHLIHIENAFQNSLNMVRGRPLHAYLVHDAKDLLVSGSEQLWLWMKKIKSEGLVRHIGVSVYDCETARTILDRYDPDIIQIPYNIFDQRLDAEDFFKFCSDRSVKLHVRSIFLQGAILMHQDALPQYLKGLQANLAQLLKFSKVHKVSVYLLALAFVARRPEIEHIVVGVHNKVQLFQMLSTWKQLENFDASSIDWQPFACNNLTLIDPRHWS